MRSGNGGTREVVAVVAVVAANLPADSAAPGAVAGYHGHMPRRVGDYRGLTHLSRLRLLHAVQRGPGRRLAELADEVELHANTAREHLTVLEREGLVKSRPLTTGTRGRPPVVYHPVDDAELSAEAARRAARARERGDLLRRLSPHLDHAADIGEEASHQLDTLYEHLDDAGFEPSLDEDQLTVSLVPCKYFAAMDEDRGTVCSVHVRLIQQHLLQVPGPVELRRVEPFVTPTSCTIALGLAGEETRASRRRGESGTQPEAGSAAEPASGHGEDPVGEPASGRG